MLLYRRQASWKSEEDSTKKNQTVSSYEISPSQIGDSCKDKSVNTVHWKLDTIYNIYRKKHENIQIT